MSSRLESRGGKNGGSYKIKAAYTYRFGDIDYTSDSFDFSGADYGSEYAMKKFAERYQPGQTVDCFVNPENPGEAVVYRGFAQFSFAGILIAGGLFLCGLSAFAYEFIKKPKGEKNETA